ncbi:uncharacterized protein VP01_6782g2 [Puccinia sorghi]|uniref:Uncharacterized protein n=1 Tax=Puccinia sorghi TaxID=27349 RepID=A0A0L6UEP1_9BASI|nr:uncharacterized protein VP01_6782g2 [Puccinia sorghi]
MTQAITPTPPPPKPTTGELTLVLHKWLPNVTKLHVNGDNFHTWVVMVQQALEGTLGYSIFLTDKELVLESEEDMLLKTALLATINDDMKVGVQILDLKLNHLNQLADLDAHFRRIENMVKNLFWSGFVLLEESLIGLFFHLLLLNLESFPFVNVAWQLHLRMEQGSMVVKNIDLLRLVKNKLTLFRNNRKPKSDCKNDKQPFASNSTSPAPLHGAVSRWCNKCKVNTHYTRECSKPATAPPRGNFHANLANLPDTSGVHHSVEDASLGSIRALPTLSPMIFPSFLTPLHSSIHYRSMWPLMTLNLM